MKAQVSLSAFRKQAALTPEQTQRDTERVREAMLLLDRNAPAEMRQLLDSFVLPLLALARDHAPAQEWE